MPKDEIEFREAKKTYYVLKGLRKGNIVFDIRVKDLLCIYNAKTIQEVISMGIKMFERQGTTLYLVKVIETISEEVVKTYNDKSQG